MSRMLDKLGQCAVSFPMGVLCHYASGSCLSQKNQERKTWQVLFVLQLKGMSW
jgi:hypothetical protein